MLVRRETEQSSKQNTAIVSIFEMRDETGGPKINDSSCEETLLDKCWDAAQIATPPASPTCLVDTTFSLQHFLQHVKTTLDKSSPVPACLAEVESPCIFFHLASISDNVTNRLQKHGPHRDSRGPRDLLKATILAPAHQSHKSFEPCTDHSCSLARRPEEAQRAAVEEKSLAPGYPAHQHVWRFDLCVVGRIAAWGFAKTTRSLEKAYADSFFIAARFVEGLAGL